MPVVAETISGVTKDETGAAFGGCTVHLLRMVPGEKPVIEGITVSDATTGAYSFGVNPTSAYWCVSYKTGATDKAGATNTTLSGI